MKYLPILFLVFLICTQSGCGKKQEPEQRRLTNFSESNPPISDGCVECHPMEVEQWKTSHHAHALSTEPVNFDKSTTVVGSFTSTVEGASLTQTGPDGYVHQSKIDAVLAYTPIQQMLVAAEGGRWQVYDPAYDPRSNEWFGVYGDQDRRPEEWGHWSRDGMNWNTQCAYCHTTKFEKNYDPETDSYHSSWDEVSVSCTQCHTALAKDKVRADGCTVEHEEDRSDFIHMQTCASCHSRREELTGAIPPGDLYDDHYRLTMPDQPNIYHHDGQVLDEDYVYGSFRMSRMHHKGVTCMDCHNPHSGDFKLPWDNNALCMQCHTAPGRDGATPIDPTTHTFHQPGSAGNLCVNCHMPHTTYMERDPRRDHGMHNPDPLLTMELGIPNACNRCHTEEHETTEWEWEHASKWWGTNFNETARARARALHRAHGGDASVVPELLRMAKEEEIPMWRATLLSLAGNFPRSPATEKALRDALKDEDALVRHASLRALEQHPNRAVFMPKMLNDTSRLVRTQAAFALGGQSNFLKDDVRKELETWLENIGTQPGGMMRNAAWALTDGRPEDAIKWSDRAVKKDSPSAHGRMMAGHVAYQAGNFQKAEKEFLQAIEMDPANADYPFNLALLYGEMKNSEKVIEMLQLAVKANPGFSRAWYNLGLSLNTAGKKKDAIEALLHAEASTPDHADFAYARATILLQMNKTEEAQEAAIKALMANPQHGPTRQLMGQLQRQQQQ